MKKVITAMVLMHLSFSLLAQNISLEPSILRFNTNLGLRANSVNSPNLQIVSSNTTAQPSLTFVNSSNNFLGTITGSESDHFRFSTSKGFNFQTISGFNFIDAMNISNAGNVGIGVTAPRYALQINAINNSDTALHLTGNASQTSMAFADVARIRTSRFSFQGFVNQGIGINSNGFIDLTSKGELRISKDLNNGVTETILTASAENGVSINNTIRSSELDFNHTSSTERRPVFADKDGILRIENSSNHYSSYNFSSVQAQDYDDQLRKGSGYAWFNTTNVGATMYLPVNLPDGVKITNVRMFLLDNSVSNLSFTLNKNSHETNTFTAIASAQSSTNTSSVFSITANTNEIVDNQNNSYYVNISSSGNWTGNTLQFHSLVITYQYQ